MSNSTVTISQIIERLKELQGEQSNRSFAKSNDISTQYLCDIYAGTRTPGEKIFEIVGVVREITYKKDTRRWR